MSATPKVDKWAFDAMPGGPEVVSANCARELEELLMAAEDENEVLHKEIERLDEMVMRWFKAASPYATPGSLKEGMKASRSSVIDQCIEACRREYLENPMKDTGDEEYDNAIKHCIDALHAMKAL